MSKNAPRGLLPDQRQSSLVERRRLKMARSAHAYVRGSTTRFYEWLETSDRLALPEGPATWICGDCHVGNLGPVGSAAGRLRVQIRDLDQAVIGNPAHDLIRLGLSLAMAARGSDLPGVVTAQMIERMTEGYERAFDKHDAHDGAVPQTVKLVMHDAARRSWKHLADERIEGRNPVIPLGKRFWPLMEDEKTAITELFQQEALRRLVVSLRSREDDAEIAVADAAYWRKGCSSLGRLRFAVLLELRARHSREVRHCLMDIKEATAAAAPRYPDAAMPRDNAARVVEGARHLSPYLGERMLASRLLDRSVTIRELLPQDLKFEIERLDQAEAAEVAFFLAQVVGHAHARQLDRADRKAWRAELGRSRSKSLDAPSWLWRSVVELVANHEAAYLEHCRRYATRTDAEAA